jgi:hypothetical protein
MAFNLDPNLEEFATPEQWAKLQAWEEHGSVRAAATALGIHHKGISAAKKRVELKALKAGYSPQHDMTRVFPEGYRLRGTSTMYGKDGGIKLQWVKSELDKDRQMEMFMEVVEEMTKGVHRIEPTPAPAVNTDSLLSCYPVGDHHMGMLSWDKETGEDWDVKIAEKLLADATSHLVAVAPNSKNGLIVFLGDFMHYDSFVPQTPTSKNHLDADSRFPKMVRAAIRCMRHTIDTAKEKHEHVDVIIEIGNHDLSSSIFLMECLNNVYENEPRVTIDTSPMHYHYHRFGKCLIGTHHGHGSKMQQLPIIMAADRKEDWGDTDYRYWWTGHIHHSKTQAAVSSQDFTGCSVESFRVLPPMDAWAHQQGYRSLRDMKSIILHADFGEVSRNTVNPAMFE